MKMEKMYIPTLRDKPAEAESESHQLLVRAGMVRRMVSGMYAYLPLGYRVIRKIEQITREEMDAAGAQELLMPIMAPRELWEETGRWQDFGPELFRLKDRHGRELLLGPTHEEYFTNIIKGEINSYKQLPLNIYHIQPKYRDELRPRHGVVRSREFIMKDAYSFDLDADGMRESYRVMWEAYENVFDRLKLEYKIVEGDSGAMGGSDSHEYVATSDTGEAAIAYCKSCDYAATEEKAIVALNVANDEEEKPMEKVYTPNIRTIEDLEEMLNIDGANSGKALAYIAAGEVVIAFVPGDRQLNETKLCNHLGIAGHQLEMADDGTIARVTGAEHGFTGPIDLKEDVKVLIDSRLTKMKNIVVGANETDYHIKNANYGRDFDGEVVEDLLQVEKEDACPKCGEPLHMERGIEVGNIFQLGTKYSESLNVNFLDENGKEKPFVMGCYGIGVSRSMAAVVEQSHDEHGIVWPLVAAPYHAVITVINVKDEEQKKLGEEIYEKLSNEGVEVMLDNRNERAGVKFNDRDLIGIPIRITVGRKASENIVEYSLRESIEENVEISVDDIMDKIKEEFEKQNLSL